MIINKELFARSAAEAPAKSHIPDRGPIFRKVAIALITLDWISIIIRFYTRRFMTKSLGLDDWLFLISTVIFSVYVFSVIEYINHGLGRHEYDLAPGATEKVYQFWWIAEATYVMSTTILKVAFGAFFLRITTVKWQRAIIYTLNVACIIFGICFGCILMFECRPVSYAWTRFGNGKGKCLPAHVILGWTYAHSVLAAVVDWTIAILPIFMLRQVQLNLKAKVSIVALLSMGAMASVTTLIRFQYIPDLTHIDDFTWYAYGIGLWSTIEPGVALFAGGLAVCRPLVQRGVNKMKTVNDRYRSRLSTVSTFRGTSSTGTRNGDGSCIEKGIEQDQETDPEQDQEPNQEQEQHQHQDRYQGRDQEQDTTATEKLMPMDPKSPGDSQNTSELW